MSLLCAQRLIRPEVTGTELGQQRAAFLSQYLWPTLSTLRIYFFPLPPADQLNRMQWQTPQLPSNVNASDYLDPLYATLQNKVDPIALVKGVVEQRIAPLVGLTFTYTDNIAESDIRIVFGPEYGCSSIVGNTKFVPTNERQNATMTYGWFDVATVIHEFCHALGMIHEHQNPRDNPIQWNKEAIYCYYRATQGWNIEQIDQNVIRAYSLDQTNGSKYDPASIMIYPFNKTLACTLCKPMDPNDASECPSKTLQTTTDGMAVRPNYKLSPTDTKWLQIMYPKDGKRDLTLITNISTDVEPGSPPERQFGAEDDVPNAIVQFVRDHFKAIVIAIAALLALFVLSSLFGKSGNGGGRRVPYGPYPRRR